MRLSEILYACANVGGAAWRAVECAAAVVSGFLWWLVGSVTRVIWVGAVSWAIWFRVSGL